MKFKQIICTLFILQLLFIVDLFAQGRPYEGPDDPAGDIAAERTGWMNGNRVLVYYRNTTELSDHVSWFSTKWPNDLDGTKVHDGMCLLIGSRIYLENDSIPVTDPLVFQSRNDLDSLFFCQSSYREHMDLNGTRTVEWGLYPVFGYFNETSETPAMSNFPESWPLLGWPGPNNTLIWPGEWNGRFGRGVMKADLECFFVVNDAQDQEYLGSSDIIKYFPRPGVRIGDKKPDVSIQKGMPWGGIGIRVQTRGFQWSNPSAQDAIFWEYTIANISEYDLAEMYFGIYCDLSVGGETSGDEGADDVAYFNKSLNMCYAWDIDGIPLGGGKEPGVFGIAYLESPGKPNNGVDDDDDGLIDERRDNDAMDKIGPTDGIDDINKFLAFYHYDDISELKEHWDADEDQDWQDWNDANNNDEYDAGEDIGDDVGLDGVGPLDLNYNGPDIDGTEANHKPDRKEGIAEPNFAETDVSESDMIGLTSFKYIRDWSKETGYGVGADQRVFEKHNDGIFDDAQMVPENFVEQFASGLFPLYQGQTERISMSNLHAYEILAGLNSSEHSAPALFRLKEVVQLIYESDYRFAQPPIMPTLTANPADEKVYLSWDSDADQFTNDVFAGRINDFEGYKLYRSSDPYFADPMIITDGYGSPTLRKPIFECDLIDTRRGFADYGAINGIQYYLGTDSGIKHSFIDNTVQNGKTYYYVIVAYDYGLPDVGGGISPSENNFVLEIDENENIRRISRNVAVVTPHKFAAGYPSQGTDLDLTNASPMVRNLPVTIDIFDRDNVKKGHTYKLKPRVNKSLGHLQTSTRFRSPYDIKFYNDEIHIYDVTLGDSLIYREAWDPDIHNPNIDSVETEGGIIALTDSRDIVTELFDGLRLTMRMPTILPKPDLENSGWVVGNSPVRFYPAGNRYQYFPWQYEIIWTDDSLAHTTITNNVLFQTIYGRFGEALPRNDILLNQSFNFYVINKSFVDTLGNYPRLDMLVHDINGNGQFDLEYDEVLVGHWTNDNRPNSTFKFWSGTIFVMDFNDISDDSELPKPNDVFQINFDRAFYDTDSLLFTITGLEDELDREQLKNDMKKIKVVPNPYVATNTMEPAVANWDRNQQRRIMFTHVPAKCTIKIFTVSGVLVDEIIVDNSIQNRSSQWDLNSGANGTAFWDLRSKEGLEVAAGYYIYHVEATLTGDTKIGKFAIIK